MPLKLDTRIQSAVNDICDALDPDAIKPSDVLPGESNETARERLRELVAITISDHIRTAYEAGKQDGLDEALQMRRQPRL